MGRGAWEHSIKILPNQCSNDLIKRLAFESLKLYSCSHTLEDSACHMSSVWIRAFVWAFHLHSVVRNSKSRGRRLAWRRKHGISEDCCLGNAHVACTVACPR